MTIQQKISETRKNKRTINKLVKLMEKRNLLRQILFDFENSYTWNFKAKLERSIDDLNDSIRTINQDSRLQ